MTGQAFTAETARAYLRNHDRDVKRWHRLGKAARVALIHSRAPQGWIFGGPEEWSQGEHVTWLAAHEYPDVAAAREVLYREIAR